MDTDYERIQEMLANVAFDLLAYMRLRADISINDLESALPGKVFGLLGE